MRRLIKILTYLACISIFCINGFSVSVPCHAASSSILPKNLTISKKFSPGYGAPVGKMILTQGKVFVVHQRIASGFHAKRGIPLYKGDTIFTEKRARARFKLNDGSIMTLSSLTKLTINKSIYRPQKKSRSSFLSLALGKARFLVTKMFKFRKSAFKVKSGTFVAGVRGSDFIITQTAEKTVVTALEKTTLEVMHMNAPEQKPILLSPFQRTSGVLGGRLQRPQNLPPQEIEILKKSFSLPGDPGSSSSGGDSKADKKEKGQLPINGLPADLGPEDQEPLFDPDNPIFDPPDPGPPPEPPELPIPEIIITGPPVVPPEIPPPTELEPPPTELELPDLPGTP
jgi:hypothetical protein